jgi:hypothetical protein
MDKKKISLLVLVGLALALGVMIYINRRNVRNGEQPEETCPDFTPLYLGEPNVNSEDSDLSKKVQLGDYGPEVAYLQERLNTQYGASVTIDGKFGCDTWEAVKELTGLDSLAGIDLNDLK